MNALLPYGLGLMLLTACGPETGRTASDFVEIPGLGATRIDVPRPTSVAGDCDLAFDTAESTADRVRALRDIGFFADREDTSDAELASEIETRIAEEWGDQLPPDDPFFELFVAERDADRVWWRDLEADVVDGNEVYVTTMEEWAFISVGAFRPTSIAESWESDIGPVEVTFAFDGNTHVLEAEYFEDWIDPRIMGRVNELLETSGRQFSMVKAFDQTAYVLALTDDERRGLEARGWCFE